MSEPTIYNCHVHTFTNDAVPQYFLRMNFGSIAGTALSWFMRLGWVRRGFAAIARRLSPLSRIDWLQRLAALYTTGSQPDQTRIFKQIQRQYPKGTVFVVLPMNLHHAGLGTVKQSLDSQHQELLALAAKSGGAVVPFYAADPREKNLLDDARAKLGPDGFRGVKIYPNLGYRPDDPALMEVYKLCVERNLPVMSHCSPGGMWKYKLTENERRHFGRPRGYENVLKTLPGLRLCLAHFGGSQEWDKHLKNTGQEEDATWVEEIKDMITCGDFPNLYTDISYLAFQVRPARVHVDYVDYLKVLLADRSLRQRVLFGSDFPAIEQEALTEKEVSVTLRSRLGEYLYFQIAHHNPRRFLGLTAVP